MITHEGVTICPKRRWVIYKGKTLEFYGAAGNRHSSGERADMLRFKLIKTIFLQPATNRELIEALYQDEDGGPLTADNCIAVMLAHLKHRLATVGLTIISHKYDGENRMRYSLGKL